MSPTWSSMSYPGLSCPPPGFSCAQPGSPCPKPCSPAGSTQQQPQHLWLQGETCYKGKDDAQFGFTWFHRLYMIAHVLHGCTWPFMIVYSFTWSTGFFTSLNIVLQVCKRYIVLLVCQKVVHVCTSLHTIVHRCTPLYIDVHGYTRIYMAVHGCTILYMVIQGFIRF